MKIILLIIIFTFSCSSVKAQWHEAINSLHGAASNCITLIDDNIFIGTANGVFLSTDSGDTWIEKNDGLTNTNISCIIIDESNIFVGTEDGIYQSSNYGNSWHSISNGLSNKVIRHIAIDGINIYVATQEGLYHTNNNGNSWSNIGGGGNITSMVTNHNKLFVSRYGLGVGIHTDNGNKYEHISTGLVNNIVYGLATNGDSTFIGTRYGVFLYLEETKKWISKGLENTDIDDITIYGNSFFAKDLGGRVFRSTNNGDKWTQINTGGYLPNIETLSRGGNFLVFGSQEEELFISTNNGIKWKIINTGLTESVLSFAIKDKALFAGTRYGVFLSNDTGNNWVDKNEGLSSWNFRSFAIAIDKIFTGSSDGVYLTTDNGDTWTAKNKEKLYFGVLTMIVDESNIFAGTDEGGVFLTTNNGNSWTTKNIGLNNTYISSLFINESKIFAGTGNGVFVSENKGNNWIPKGLSEISINCLISNGKNIFAGTNIGVFLTTNNGNEWVPKGLNGKSVSSLLIYDNKVLAATYGEGIYQSTNNGNDWSSKNKGLINQYVYSLIINNGDVFAGTDGGVFKRNLSDLLEFNLSPTISLIQDTTITENSTVEIKFKVNDEQPDSLIIIVQSSNQDLIPNSNIKLSGSNEERTLLIIPTKNYYGISQIILSVSDEESTVLDTFNITVLDINQAPTISYIQDIETNENEPIEIEFVVYDEYLNSLIISAKSTDQNLIPDDNISLSSGSGNYRKINITPNNNKYGNCEIILSINDGEYTVVDTFKITVIKSVYVSDTIKNGTFLKVYPNPAIDFIAISMKPLYSSEIHIYNTLGEKVMTILADPYHSSRIDVSGLPKGMYLIRSNHDYLMFVKM